jgi:UDP-glucuronate 4-epimerase
MMPGEKPYILITGAAGFMGFHVSKKLLQDFNVIGVDNINSYYDEGLKQNRLAILKKDAGFTFFHEDLADKRFVADLFEKYQFDYVIHLAAQAGVRYSMVNPYAYISSNINAFLNILEGCRHHKIRHLLYASSSSVYGSNRKMPFSPHDPVDHPVSLYAATKKSNELMAHSYSSNYDIPTTGLRFFTVYGPYGRPDMAIFLFTKAIIEGKPIDVFNHGKMKRDFTYIDDVVESIRLLLPMIPEPNSKWNAYYPDPATSFAPYKIYNLGNNNPVQLNQFIEAIEKSVGKKAVKNFMPLQEGDIVDTFADVQELEETTGFKPSTSIEKGVDAFVKWYREYYNA